MSYREWQDDARGARGRHHGRDRRSGDEETYAAQRYSDRPSYSSEPSYRDFPVSGPADGRSSGRHSREANEETTGWTAPDRYDDTGAWTRGDHTGEWQRHDDSWPVPRSRAEPTSGGAWSEPSAERSWTPSDYSDTGRGYDDYGKPPYDYDPGSGRPGPSPPRAYWTEATELGYADPRIFGSAGQYATPGYAPVPGYRDEPAYQATEPSYDDEPARRREGPGYRDEVDYRRDEPAYRDDEPTTVYRRGEVFRRDETGYARSEPAPPPEQPVYQREEPAAYRRGEPAAYRPEEPGTYRRGETGYARSEPAAPREAYQREEPSTYPREERSTYPREEPGAYPREEPGTYRRGETGYARSEPAAPREAYQREESSAYPPRGEPGYRREELSGYRRDEPESPKQPGAYRRDEPGRRREEPAAYRREEPAYRREEPGTYRREEPGGTPRDEPASYRREDADSRRNESGYRPEPAAYRREKPAYRDSDRTATTYRRGESAERRGSSRSREEESYRAEAPYGETGSYRREGRSYRDIIPRQRSPLRRPASANGALEEDDQPDPGGYLPSLLYTVMWFAVPLVLWIIYSLTLSGEAAANCVNDNGVPCASDRTAALSTLLNAMPRVGVTLLLSLIVAAVLRWVSESWRAVTVGFAAAVVGGGSATVLFSVVTGQAIG